MSYDTDLHAQRLDAIVHRTSRKRMSSEAWLRAIHRRACGVDLWDPSFVTRRRANLAAYRLDHHFALTDLAQVVHQYVEPSQPVPGSENGDVVAELMDELDALLAGA
jgi:hypothetical protein